MIQHIQHHRIWQFFQLSDLDKKSIMNKIISNFDQYQFDTFINNYYGYLSKNIYAENLIFSTVFQELDQKDFDSYYSVDLKNIIATSNSFIQRPNIIKPLVKSLMILKRLIWKMVLLEWRDLKDKLCLIHIEITIKILLYLKDYCHIKQK